MNRALCAAVGGVIVFASAALARPPIPYDFEISTSRSGLNATLAAGVGTSGTLLGDYDATNNPTGTRTKPGIFGSFGDTENVAVAVQSLGLALDGDLDSQTGGTFRMAINTVDGTVQVSGFQSDFLAGGPIEIPAIISLLNESFRTRNPSSIFPGGVPLEIPFGNVTVSALRATQTEIGLPGTLTPTGPNTYDFAVVPIVTLEATFSFLGNEIVVPGIPLPLALAGQITLSGDDADLTSLQPLSFDNTLDPDQPLPEIPFPLPTILPPGGVANVLMNLTLSEIYARLDGELTLGASGRIVPAPSAAGGIACALGLAAARRRRRSNT